MLHNAVITYNSLLIVPFFSLNTFQLYATLAINFESLKTVRFQFVNSQVRHVCNNTQQFTTHLSH
jgi:hypothetical protein